jgi:hypothetical protein
MSVRRSNLRFAWTLLLMSLFLSRSYASAQVASAGSPNGRTAMEKHSDRVLIIVLENQSYVFATKDKYLQELANEGVEFTDFRALAHPSYPNYLAMVAGNTFGIHGMRGDTQKRFPDDAQHRTIADLLVGRIMPRIILGKSGNLPIWAVVRASTRVNMFLS